VKWNPDPDQHNGGPTRGHNEGSVLASGPKNMHVPLDLDLDSEAHSADDESCWGDADGDGEGNRELGFDETNPNEGYEGCEIHCNATAQAAAHHATKTGNTASGNNQSPITFQDIRHLSPSSTRALPPSSRGNDPCPDAQVDSEDKSLPVAPQSTGYTFAWHSIDARTPPQVESAKFALADLKNVLHPPCPSGHGFKATGLTSLIEKRLMWMEYFLCAFVNGMQWSAAALQTVQFIGKGTCMSRKVREWSKAYILDHENLPSSKYGGTWTKSRIDDEDLKEELLTHLQSLGKYVSASAIVNYLKCPDVQRRYKLTKTITLSTAERWMGSCGFRWTVARGGQCVDGHEREDIVNYRQNIFLPAWYALDSKLRRWKLVDGKLVEEDENNSERCTVIWFHDESTFYAHDRRKKRWVHSNEKATPQPKGEGISLMVADFVSADYGWLRSPDGKESARVLFRAGKSRDGYFANNEILQHIKTAKVILQKHYPNEDHVFVFDNATTHLKRADDALSA
jgi:hypothetical protein